MFLFVYVYGSIGVGDNYMIMIFIYGITLAIMIPTYWYIMALHAEELRVAVGNKRLRDSKQFTDMYTRVQYILGYIGDK